MSNYYIITWKLTFRLSNHSLMLILLMNRDNLSLNWAYSSVYHFIRIIII